MEKEATRQIHMSIPNPFHSVCQLRCYLNLQSLPICNGFLLSSFFSSTRLSYHKFSLSLSLADTSTLPLAPNYCKPDWQI